MSVRFWDTRSLDYALKNVEWKFGLAENADDSLYKINKHTFRTKVPSLSFFPNVMNIFPDSSQVYDYIIFQNIFDHSDFLSELTFGEIEAWTAHELGHVPRIESLKKSFGMVTFPFNYLANKQFRVAFERDADIEAFKRGFGFELLISAKKSFVSKHMSANYKRFEDLYLPPWEVLAPYAPRILTKSVYDDIINASSVQKLNAFYELKK